MKARGPNSGIESDTAAMDQAVPNKQFTLPDVAPVTEVGLVCRCYPNGILAANVPQAIIEHSPSGFGCGYLGSGAADFALNVLHQFLPPKNDGTDTKGLGGCIVSADVWRLHQRFKEDFIARLPEEGGEIPLADILQWISDRVPKFTWEAK
jgi:hypothetical protein